MTDQSIPRIVKDATKPTDLLKVDNCDLEAIRNLVQQGALAITEARALQAQASLEVARVLKRLDMPIDRSTICLDCGSVRLTSVQKCPVCVR
jgi:hypothetical protein